MSSLSAHPSRLVSNIFHRPRHLCEESRFFRHALRVFSIVFIANNESAKVVQPCKEALNFPASGIPPERATILGGNPSVAAIGGDKLDSVILSHLTVQAIAIVGFVPNEALGHRIHNSFLERGLHQSHLSWRSTLCPNGDGKTMAVCNCHDLGSLAPLGFPDVAPPFLAGTNVPSTKHSFRSKPPSSWRCLASTRRSSSMTRDFTQF